MILQISGLRNIFQNTRILEVPCEYRELEQHIVLEWTMEILACLDIISTASCMLQQSVREASLFSFRESKFALSLWTL